MNEPLQRKVAKWARRPQINPLKVPIRRRPAEGVRVYCQYRRWRQTDR